MDLTFTVELINTDFEYGDSLAMDFPVGITPNSSPNDPIYVATEGQGSEALNGVSGQVISWGDNDNSYGGIEAGVIISFSVNVTVMAGLTGSQGINVYVSGDEYDANGPAGDFAGILFVNELPATPLGALNPTDGFEAFTEIGSPVTSGNYSLSNVGGDTLNISSAAFVNGATEFSTTFAGTTIAPGDSVSFSFTYDPTDLMDDVDTFRIMSDGGDFDIPMLGYAFGNGMVLEGFEDLSYFPTCQWKNTDNDGDGNFWFSYTFSPHSGTYSAASASWTGGTALTPDNFLITPQVTPTATANFFSWFAAAQDPGFPSDFYEVLVSTTGNDPADFTTSLFSETLADDIWRERSVDLTPYIGQNIYLAFRHHMSNDWFYMKVDDVRMPAQTTPNASLPPLDVSASAVGVNCPGETTGAMQVTLTGGGSVFTYTYIGLDTLTTDATTGFIGNLGVGSYPVIVNDNCGFVDSDTAVVDALNPLDDAGFTYPWATLYQNEGPVGPAIVGTTGGVFTATPAGLVFTDVTTGKIDAAASTVGTYTITYATSGPCPNTSTATITIEAEGSHTSIDALSAQGLSVYPNPSQGQFFLKNLSSSREASIQIVDMQGKVVYQEDAFLAGNAVHEINVSEIAAGMYLLKVQSNEQIGMERIVIR